MSYTVLEDKVTLSGPSSSSAEVYFHGATVTSWCDISGTERLYLSPTAVLDGSAPIRGGIPVCWPQFGPGPRWPKQHGFARRMRWTLDEAAMSPASPTAVLLLRDTSDTRAGYPGEFELRLTVGLGKEGELEVEFSVCNRSEVEDMTFSTALHSYFAVEDVGKVAVRAGLKGGKYRDNTDGNVEKVEEKDEILVLGEVDRAYIGTNDEAELRLPNGKSVVLEKVGLPELVVWNPAVDKTAALPDMPDDDWKKFICLEPAMIDPALTLPKGESYTGRIILSVKDS